MSGFIPVAADRRLVLSALAMLLVVSGPAQACRCRELALPDYFARADRVAEARIVAVAEATRVDGTEIRRFTLALLQQFKGETFEQVLSYASTASCGVVGQAGDQLWVFAIQQAASSGADLWIDSCGGTRRAETGFPGIAAAQTAHALRLLAARASVLEPDSIDSNGAQGIDGAAAANVSALSARLRSVHRDQIEAPWKDALQRAAVLAPNGRGRAAVLVPDPVARPPHRTHILIDHQSSEVLALVVHGSWSAEALQWINDNWLYVRLRRADGHAAGWIIDAEQGRILWQGSADD